MGFVSRLVRPKALGAWSPDDDRWYTPGGSFYEGILPTAAGMPVDADTAMRLITVQNCVRMRASTLSRLPCHLMETDGRLKSKATDDPLYEQLLYQPNAWQTAPEFWGMAEAFVSLRGEFIAYKLGIPGQTPLALVPLKPASLVEITQDETFALTYHVRFKTGEIVPLPQDRFFHLRGLTLDGIRGSNPIEYARETLGKALASERHLARWFGNGLHPSAVITHPLSLSASAHANLRANLKAKYEGISKSHEFMLIDEGMTINFPEIKLVDAQFLEQMKLTEAQICGLFRVPLMLVAAGDKASTYASSEQFMLFYQMFSIDVANYEAAIRRDLIAPDDRARLFAKFSLAALSRGDMQSRFASYQIGVNTEIYSPNEVRDLEDMNPYEGGDEYRTRTSTVKAPAGDPAPGEQGGATR
jgi:HK97 family phage portal protein